MAGVEKPLGAQAQANFASDKDGWKIVLDRDSSGKDQERACVAMFQAIPPGIVKFAGVELGYAVVRLWNAPQAAIRAYAAYTNTESDVPLAYSLALGGGVANEVEHLGARTETISEVISFSNSMESELSRGYSASNVDILDVTNFINSAGNGIAGPSYAGGKFTLNEPGYGSVVVEYTASYEAYRVYYGLPNWVADKVYNKGMKADDVTMPPILVMAYLGGQSASLQVERKISKVTPEPCAKNEWLTDPASSIYVRYKVYPESEMLPTTPPTPRPNANFLENKAYLKHVEFCKAEPTRKRSQDFYMPSGDNIEIIETQNGAI